MYYFTIDSNRGHGNCYYFRRSCSCIWTKNWIGAAILAPVFCRDFGFLKGIWSFCNAGFNSVDLTLISEVGQMLIIILMIIGGSPGSTAGGMKTTTIAVLVSSALSVFRKKEHAHFFGRRISDNTIKNVATILLMYITLFLTGGMIISSIDNIPLITALFETASAIGTVGLSLGITSELGIISHLILIFLMFLGRVGGLTLVFAALSERKPNSSKYPQEKITVG